MQKSERWGGVGVGNGPNTGNPSARLRAARSMPHWMETRVGLPTPPPPPPPPEPEPIPTDPDYEVIDVPTQNYSNTPFITTEVRVRRCELCGASGPSVLCEQCPQQSFCPSCDEMYHRHPKRQSHMRRAIIDTTRPGEPPRPPLPPKGEGVTSSAPVPPPRKNKKNVLPPGSSSTLKRETGIVGSIKRMITGKAPARPPPLSRDRSASLINNNMDFHSNQMMMGDNMDLNGWSRSGRVGSMTALNMPAQFGPMMHAQSMAHMGCPGCWGWGSQAALHQTGMQGPHMHGMIPPHPPQPYWYPSWDPRRQRRHHHGRPPLDSSSDEDDRPSPALSRKSISRAVDSDSDDSFKKSRPHSRRESFADLRRRDDDTRSLRGGRYDDDTRSLRGDRRDSFRRREDLTLDRSSKRNRRFDDAMSERGGRRMDDTVSERGGIRRRQDEIINDERILRRKDDDTFSERGGRRTSETRYREPSWDRHFKRTDKTDIKYQREPSMDKTSDKRRERYTQDSDSDKRSNLAEDKRQNKLVNNFKREEIKNSTASTKSSETISSIVSTTSGEDKGRWNKKDRFSDTDQKRRATIENNFQLKSISDKPNEKPGLTDKEKPLTTEPTKESDDDMKPLGAIPTSEWECQHCTYVNRPGSRVCEVCCKTKTVESENIHQENTVEDEVITVETKLSKLNTKEEIKETIVEVKEEKEEIKVSKDQKQTDHKTETTEEQQKKKEPLVEATTETQPTKSLTSKSTSPPPQSISTQTYDVAGLSVKNSSTEVNWTSPRRSFSRQSLVSETAQSGISPSRSRSPVETDQLSQITEPRQTQSRKNNDMPSILTRKTSRASSLINEQANSMVQKQVNQGLEMVKLLREAEIVGFSGEEVSVAVEHCGDGSPLQWLIENWTHMIDTVVTLATNYGHERKENTIGTVSEREARAALIQHQGSVWSAVTEVVQQRQNKYGELLSRGNFSREDIVTALTAHHGDLEAAYIELTKGQLKPFLRRIWAPSNHIGTASHFTH